MHINIQNIKQKQNHLLGASCSWQTTIIQRTLLAYFQYWQISCFLYFFLFSVVLKFFSITIVRISLLYELHVLPSIPSKMFGAVFGSKFLPYYWFFPGVKILEKKQYSWWILIRLEILKGLIGFRFTVSLYDSNVHSCQVPAYEVNWLCQLLSWRT